MERWKKGKQEETPVKSGYTLNLHYTQDTPTSNKSVLLLCEIVQSLLLLEAWWKENSLETHILHLLRST